MRTIASFLKQYADDLGRLANTETLRSNDSLICLSACHLVRKVRHDLAHRLWHVYQQGPVVNEDDVYYQSGQDPLELPEVKFVEEVDSKFVYSVAERFLFDTDPIQALETSVKAFVKMNLETEMGHQRLPGHKFIKTCFTNFMTMCHSPVKQDTCRITWTCVSGHDYQTDSSQTASSQTLLQKWLIVMSYTDVWKKDVR